MNYMQYINGDDANGTGMRCTLFVAGCEMACEGCHNVESWKITAGSLYTKEFEDQIIEDLKSPFIFGFSASGGNPTHPKNYKTMLKLFKRIKAETGKNIWMWTGMTLEELQSDERGIILNYVDVLIDGKFVQELKDTNLKWKGSLNQRVINVEEIV
jgi:anaerobic ribonucleoside-triphosphate reductase activating protein